MKPMKIWSKVVSVSTLSLFLGVSGWVFAQEQQEEAKPNDESRPAASKPAHDEKAKPAHEDKRGDSAKSQQQETGKAPEQTEDKSTRQENTKQGDRNEHSSQTQMQAQGGDHRGGGRIPEDKFKSNFGRQHTFKVSRPTVVGGQPQFQYGGYSFNIIGAWPVDWSYDDAVYVDYINGEYFLFDLAHPGVSVAIVVVM
jgi:hypothetical protein